MVMLRTRDSRHERLDFLSRKHTFLVKYRACNTLLDIDRKLGDYVYFLHSHKNTLFSAAWKILFSIILKYN